MDIRNRIIRRFPFTLPLRWALRFVGRSTRKLSRTGLLEYHYEKFVFGDTSLFELPERPQLHILATNLSEGCLCSFTRDGLLMVRRQQGNGFRIDRTHIGLATVAMAVTASSAFPGFFPPLELNGAEVGANIGEFGRQTYTDGGIFDNLGVRMFRCLERPMLAEAPLSRDDFVDFPGAVELLEQAGKSADETPLRRLMQLMAAAQSQLVALPSPGAGTASAVGPPATAGNGGRERHVVSGLWDLVRHYPFQRDPLFAGLKLVDADAEALLHASGRSGRDLGAHDQLWLNRHLLEAAFRQATGRPCFRRLNRGLDCVLVSDVGKPMEVKISKRAGGLIRTTLRSTDILMDRVWQLEMDTFYDTPGFVFAPVTEVVEPADDPTALHPELQRQLPHIRTDLDRFSALEISTLARHGYCVGRKACRQRPDLFGKELPDHAPWDPIPGQHESDSPAPAAKGPFVRLLSHLGEGKKWEPVAATAKARALHGSAVRRIWSTLLDYRDWVSYVYVPLIVPILILLPYVSFNVYQRTHRINRIAKSLAQSSRDLEQMSELLDGPVSIWKGEPHEEVGTLGEPDMTGFKVLQDMHIHDLRNWNPAPSAKGDPSSMLYSYRRLKVVKTAAKAGKEQFRLRLLPTSPDTLVRFPPQQLHAKLRKGNVEGSVSDQRECRWEASFDFESVPVGDHVDLMVENMAPGQFLRRDENSTTLTYYIQAETAELTRWMLLPKGTEYRSFRIVRHKTAGPDKVEDVKIVTEYLADDYTILAYKLLSVDGGYTYEVTWYYK
jgi:hypothetical protein